MGKNSMLTWVAIAVLFIWCFRITKLIGETQKHNENMTTQILNVLVAVGQKVGVQIRVEQAP
jgi:uncharacterized membrane protein (DUF373 family)